MKSWLVMGVLSLCLVDVCSAQAGNPRTAGTLDILFSGDSDKYLAGKRAELARLQDQLSALDDRLLSRLGELHAEEARLQKVRGSNAQAENERKGAEDEVRALKQQAERAYQQTAALKGRADGLKLAAKASAQEARAEEEKVSALKSDVQRLEDENRILDRAINRTLKSKAEQNLR
jgi:chromosome segregation ATPase